MATITKIQLRQRVGEELKVYSPDQEMSADVAARIEPATPQQVFAGESTVTAFLRFADEAEARSVLSAYWTAP